MQAAPSTTSTVGYPPKSPMDPAYESLVWQKVHAGCQIIVRLDLRRGLIARCTIVPERCFVGVRPSVLRQSYSRRGTKVLELALSARRFVVFMQAPEDDRKAAGSISQAEMLMGLLPSFPVA